MPTSEQQISVLIDTAKDQIESANAILRLKGNKDFQKIFLSKYLITFAAELVRTKAQAQMQDNNSQRYIDGQINAIGHLSQFMDTILTQGVTAVSSLKSHEAELTAVLGED